MSKNLSAYVTAGYISGAHGIRGEIILVSQINDIDLLGDVIVLAKDGEVLEIGVDSLRPHKGGFLLLSKDIPTRNAAEKLRGYSWVLPKEKMVSAQDEKIFLREIEGFTVRDENLGEIGEIVGFSSNGAQDLAEVTYRNKKVLVPLVKAFLVQIDFSARVVRMNLPAGLLED